QSRNNDNFVCGRSQEEEPVVPVIDGVVGTDEWAGCTSINLAGDKGTACVIAYTDYMYVKYELNDPTDDRSDNSYPGNDKLGLNINPAGDSNWGKPYGIIFQTGTDPAAFTSPDPFTDNSSSGTTDGYASEWMNGNSQLTLPVDVETKTLPYAGTRISEWKLPLSSIAGLLSGSTLKVGGAADIEMSSYSYPSTLNWATPFSTFTSVTVQ
ncbi:MAG: hypothetical protein AAB503_01255, partial [Patescibacteria group bacterium]